MEKIRLVGEEGTKGEKKGREREKMKLEGWFMVHVYVFEFTESLESDFLTWQHNTWQYRVEFQIIACFPSAR